MIHILSMIKDEQRYLDAWIEYHLNIGVDKFVLYEDYSSSPHDVSKWGDKVVLLRIPDCFNEEEMAKFKDHMFRQCIVYEHYSRTLRKECEWFAYIDVDEYIEADNVHDVVDGCENFDQVMMMYKYYTYSGHLKDPHPGEAYSLRDTYTWFSYRRSYRGIIPHLYIYWKCFYRSKWNHEDEDENTEFKMIPHSIWKIESYHTYISDIQLGHYYTKSFEEYVNGLYNVGVQDNNLRMNRRLEDFFHYNLVPVEEELIKEYAGKVVKVNEDY